MFSMVMGAFGLMDSTSFWDGRAAARTTAEEQVPTAKEQAAYREALTHLRAAQHELAKPEGCWGVDKNEILAKEIRLAIREIHSAGINEAEQEPVVADEQDKYLAAFKLFGMAEQALEKVSKKSPARKQALVHVRVAKWWVQPKASPRYTQVLKYTQMPIELAEA